MESARVHTAVAGAARPVEIGRFHRRQAICNLAVGLAQNGPEGKEVQEENPSKRVARSMHASLAKSWLSSLGEPDVEDYFQLVDFWVDGLLVSSGRKGLLEAGSVNGGSG